MWYAEITYRQRSPNGTDLAPSRCEKTVNGPFTTAEAAERFATSVADGTPVFCISIKEVIVT